jgi:hypothetical protein
MRGRDEGLLAMSETADVGVGKVAPEVVFPTI